MTEQQRLTHLLGRARRGVILPARGEALAPLVGELGTERAHYRADCQKWADCVATAEKIRQSQARDADEYEAQLRDRITELEKGHAALKRAHVALAEQAGRDQAEVARLTAGQDHTCPDGQPCPGHDEPATP